MMDWNKKMPQDKTHVLSFTVFLMRSQNETTVKHILYNYTHTQNDVKRT